MLQSEFKERTGVDSIKEYDIANLLYMLLDYDKDEFCAYWSTIRHEPMFWDMLEIIYKLNFLLSRAAKVLKL